MADSSGGGRIFVNGEDLSGPTLRARGGGEKHHPQSLEEARANLAPQLAAVAATVSSMPEHLRAERVVLEAEVFANYLANSYFPEDLVRQLKLRPLGSKIVPHGIQSLPSTGETEAVSKSFLLSADAEAVSAMDRILAGAGNTKGAADDLRQFTKISVSTAHRASSSSTTAPEAFEAVLHPDPDRSTVFDRAPASEPTLAKFSSLVESVGGRVHRDLSDVVDGLTFVTVELPADRVDDVAAFNPLRSLTPAPRVMLTETTPLDEPSESAIAAPASVSGLPEVLVFDGGIDDQGSVFRNTTTLVNLTGKARDVDDENHGSGVTAAVLYGDVANNGAALVPAAHVTHYQICPGPDHNAEEFPWVLRQIQEVARRTDARIVNLSVGPKAPVEDREPHRWTAVLDKIAYERQILFVTAAGNNGTKDAATGLNRVQSPSDMVNGLSVGASNQPAHASQWDAASYSGRGPGRPGARIQPAVMAFGGTPQQPFGRLRPTGEVFRDHHGTSYAAPVVTNALARISAQLGGRSDANTLRALAIHFAEKTNAHQLIDVGHGRLSDDVDRLLYCGPEQATVIYQGVIKRDEVRAYQLPVPSTLNAGKVNIRWSLALSTATDSAEAGEYSKAGLELTFRPHANRFSMRRPKVGGKGDDTQIVDVRDVDLVGQMQADGWKLSVNPVTKQPTRSSRNEVAKREGGKWESLWRAETTMRSSSLMAPRIDVSHLTRDGGRITTGTDDIDFSLVVTVTSHANLPVYQAVENEFSVLTALPVVTPVVIPATQVQASAT